MLWSCSADDDDDTLEGVGNVVLLSTLYPIIVCVYGQSSGGTPLDLGRKTTDTRRWCKAGHQLLLNFENSSKSGLDTRDQTNGESSVSQLVIAIVHSQLSATYKQTLTKHKAPRRDIASSSSSASPWQVQQQQR